MSIEQIQMEIQNINDNPNLSSEEKKTRISVYRTLLESTIQESKYNEHMVLFVNGAKDLEARTSGAFQVDQSMENNQIQLKGEILSSELVEKLNENGIENFTLGELRTAYSPSYALEYNIEVTNTNLAMDLYRETENIEEVKKYQMEIVARNLGSLLGNETVSSTIDTGIIEPGKGTVIKQTDKDEEQLRRDYKKAVEKIDEIYVNDGTLDLQSKTAAVTMLNELFAYYRSNDIKIPIDLINQQVVKTEEDNRSR